MQNRPEDKVNSAAGLIVTLMILGPIQNSPAFFFEYKLTLNERRSFQKCTVNVTLKMPGLS